MVLRSGLPRGLAPHAQLHLVGAGRPGAALEALLARERRHVVWHGYVPDDVLRLIYSRVKVRGWCKALHALVLRALVLQASVLALLR